MNRIDKARAASSIPEVPPQGAPGYFQKDEVGNETPVSSAWMNAVQEEIVGSIEGLGGSPDKTNVGQLSSLVASLVALGTRMKYIPFTGYNGSSSSSELTITGRRTTKTWDLSLLEGSGLDWTKIRMVQLQVIVEVADPNSYEFAAWYTTNPGIQGKLILRSRGMEVDMPPSRNIYNLMIPVLPGQDNVRLRLGNISLDPGPDTSAEMILLGAHSQAGLI